MVIGIAGKKGAGKNTFGARLINHLRYDLPVDYDNRIYEHSFAEGFKDPVMNMMGFSREQVYGDELKEVADDFWGVTPRHVMQTLGTEWGRRLIHPDIWVKVLERKIQKYPKNTIVVVTDVRFNNEVDWIKSVNGYLIRVVRDSENPYNPNDDHESENGISSWRDWTTVYNNGTLADLGDVAWSVAQDICNKLVNHYE